MRDLIKTALFFYQVANEEKLADSLVKEGSRCLDEGNLNDAQDLFDQAFSLEKWRDIYGTVILANLAYICVKKKNYIMAKQHIEDYLSMYGSSDFSIDPDE